MNLLSPRPLFWFVLTHSDQGALNGIQEITIYNFFTNNDVETNGMRALLHLLIFEHAIKNVNYAPFSIKYTNTEYDN